MTEQNNTILENTIESNTDSTSQTEQTTYTADASIFHTITEDDAPIVSSNNEPTVSATYNKLVELNDEMAQSIANLDKVLSSSKELQAALQSTNNVLFGDLINSLNNQIDEYSNQHDRLIDKKTKLEHVIECYNLPGYEDAVESLSFIFGLLK